MRTALTTLIMVLLALPAFAGNAPGPLEDHSLNPATLGSHSLQPAPVESHSLAGARADEEALLSEDEMDQAAEEAVEELENSLPDGYFTRTMKTLQGELVEIDTVNMTARVRDGSAEIEFSYDQYTIFMKDFRPAEPGKLKNGARVVGLFDDSDGELYLGRLVEISKYQSRRRRRRW